MPNIFLLPSFSFCEVIRANQRSNHGVTVETKPPYSFKAPELTGYDGKPVEIPDALAERLRRHATDEGPIGETFFNEIGFSLSKSLIACSLRLEAEMVEKAIVLSNDGKQEVEKSGNRDRVSVEARLLNDAHLIHNHPEGTPLSDSDIQALYETQLSSVWAVGNKWLYGAEIGPKGLSASSLADFTMTRTFLTQAAFAVVSDLFRNDASISEDSLETRHLHAVLCELAEAGFIRYCRVRYGA